MELDSLVEEAKGSISEFCYSECKAYCCRKGYLVLSSSEVNLLIGKKREEFLKEGFLKELDSGKFSFSLSAAQGCPRLKDFKCTIHTDEDRPSVCKKFPIFVFDEGISISQRCLALKANKFYLFSRALKSEGLQFSKSDLPDLDIDEELLIKK